MQSAPCRTKKDYIKDWRKSWHAPKHTSHTYTDVLRDPPDEGLSNRLRSLVSHGAKPDKDPPPPSRETESSLFRFLTGRAFTGEYA
jgi:hypothetical protein